MQNSLVNTSINEALVPVQFLFLLPELFASTCILPEFFHVPSSVSEETKTTTRFCSRFHSCLCPLASTFTGWADGGLMSLEMKGLC